MTQQRKSPKPPAERASRSATATEAPRRNRWLKVLAAVLGLAVVAVAIERLTRPAESLAPQGAPVAESAGQGTTLVLPPPVQLNHTELVAEAHGLAEELAQAFPNDPKPLSLSARLAYMFRQPEKAVERWEQALTLNPQWADAWLGRAELARQQGEFDKAVEYMHRLAEVAPAVAREKVFLLADCLLKAGNAQEAVDALEEAGKQTPLPGWGQVMLGQGYYQLQDYEHSAEHYRQALDDREQASVARYGLSRALIRLGRTEEAQKYRADYARMQEKVLDQFDRMQHAGTAEEREEPAAWYPILAQYHCTAGQLYAVREQREAAKRHWLRACALAPHRPEPRQLLESLGRP